MVLAAYLWSQGLLPRFGSLPHAEYILADGGGPFASAGESDGAKQGAHSGVSAQAASLLGKELQFAQRLSRQEQEAELRRQADKIGNSVRADKIPAMKSFIESAVGVGHSTRAYEPRPDAEGRFNAQTGTLYDIIRQAEDVHGVHYQVMLVDADGRAITYVIPSAQMTPDMLLAYRVFAMARRKPALRPLVDLSRKLGNEWFVKTDTAKPQGPTQGATHAHK